MVAIKRRKKKKMKRGGRGQIGVGGRKGKEGKKECYGGCNSHLSFILLFFLFLNNSTLEKD